MKEISYCTITLYLFLGLLGNVAAQKKYTDNDGEADIPMPLTISETGQHEVRITTTAEGEYQIETKGTDPYIFTEGLREDIGSDYFVLSFDYFCVTGIDQFQVFFGPPFQESQSDYIDLGASEGWVSFSFNLSKAIGNWGKKGGTLRLDLGSIPGRTIHIRNLRLRKPTEREIALEAEKEKKKIQDAKINAHLKTYLSTSFPAQISDVSIQENSVTIKGRAGSAEKENIFLAEIPLYEDITEKKKFNRLLPVNGSESNFKVKTDRYVQLNDRKYDRIFSKWAVVKKGQNGFELLSHARYADHISSQWDLPDEKPVNKKGIGGFHAGGRAPVSDLDDLGIGSVTMNIWITNFMRSKPSDQTLSFEFDGKTYYADRKSIASFDSTLAETAKRNIIVSAILLIGKASNTPDQEIGRIFEHPDCDPAGIYSMANVTSAEGLEYYAAAVDFLAKRYSRPDKKYGRIHHWIIHNEVDAGWVWTNMGEKPPLLFMDHYHKSMRTVYNIARKYNPHTKAFISLTHYWAWTVDKRFYHAKELLKILLQYSRAEGDFEWAIAHHPYPESLFEPKSWLDEKCDFTFDTPLITYKNIEVLDAWVKEPHTFYLGKYRRTVYLSEQGVNSRDYTEKHLQEQAAGMAYAWKKIENLDGIDAFQYHNWMDHRGEGGLRIGLRRFPDDEEDPAGKKPVWYVFKYADTDKEAEAFEFAKDIIGIDNWDEVLYKGNQ